MIPPDHVKQKLDGVVGSAPPDKGCEMLDGALTYEYYDENDSKNFADSDDSHILLKWEEVITKCYECQKVQYDPSTIKHTRVTVSLTTNE